MISARTNTDRSFFSGPDSGYSVDNLPPHQPTIFGANLIGGNVHLSWSASIDPDLSHYEVYRGVSRTFSPSNVTIIGTSQTNPGRDSPLFYRVDIVDAAGNKSAPSDTAGVFHTGMQPNDPIPTRFSLNQNYPNPFNLETVIRYDVAKKSYVSIIVYDLTGREVSKLVSEQKAPGRYSVATNGRNLSSGVYLCRMEAGDFAVVNKILLLK